MAILYVAAVSISDNIKDISPVTLNAIKECALLIGEERRCLGRLLSIAGAQEKPYILLNEHSTDMERDEALQMVLAAEKTVFTSDAGTPCISDPDWRFIAMCRLAGVKIMSLAGASSITAAISVSGVDASRFFFAGFPERKGEERKRFFKDIESSKYAVVFMERPYALQQTLSDMAFFKRPISISIDLGSSGERTFFNTPLELMKELSGIKSPFVVVVPKSK